MKCPPEVIKATSFDQFWRLKRIDPAILDTYDFTGFIDKFGSDKLDELFPKNPKYGQLDPAPSYLTSGKKIREWRVISKGNQRHIIDKYIDEEHRRQQLPVVTGSRGRRAKRKRKREQRREQNDEAANSW